MKNKLLKSLLVIGTVSIMVGCGGGSSSSAETDGTVLADVTATDTLGTDTNTSDISADIPVIIDSPVSKISQELTNTLAYMGNEERLAYDVYNALYKQYGTQQFIKIATNGEYQHITLVQKLVQKYKLSDDVNFTNVEVPLGYMNTAIEDMEPGKYDIAAIQTLYNDLMALATDEIEALKVGCRIEVVDVNDLDHDIALAESENADDIVAAFNILRSGSYNHYWAFNKGLVNKGVSDGCCSLGDKYCKTEAEYPASNGN